MIIKLKNERYSNFTMEVTRRKLHYYHLSIKDIKNSKIYNFDNIFAENKRELVDKIKEKLRLVIIKTHKNNNKTKETKYIFNDDTRLNIKDTPLKEAIDYTKWAYSKINLDYRKNLPNFNTNYIQMQKSIKVNALNIPRNQMPVIEPKDMEEFERRLKTGFIDIFKPYIGKENIFPKVYYSKIEMEERKRLRKNNTLPVIIKYIKASNLKPLQSQVWLNLVIKYMQQYGVVKKGSKTLETTIIVSYEHYILDGHHRWGQTMLSNPYLKMRCLFIPLNVRQLIELTKAYSVGLGNEPNM